ncbi:putative transcriptional regulatory protein [Lachnellula willkommii]|uniref:Putative transcriptional regulatory protein n=1 Tax=Lachnellula willkommii TaxID=215461 RepID=A0A559M993_9HELO|nr:putative transcriptional regulatory protein [Lachnellula willkommii]
MRWNAVIDVSTNQTKASPQGNYDERMSGTHQVQMSSPTRGGHNDINGSTNDPSVHDVSPPESTLSNTRSLSWLLASSLPNQERVCQLFQAYFTNIHPLRCFGFIHKPSMMEKLDLGITAEHHNSALLHAICALGAKFYALEYLDWHREFELSHVLSAGTGWALKARSLLCNSLSQISIENLMAAVLLEDYYIRVGDYMAAFMLSGTAARMVQGLQINLESSTDILCSESKPLLGATARESRRRLMWSCFVMDSWVGSGVDQLTLLDESNIKVQLPCNERSFLQQIPCITETMAKGQILEFLPEDSKPVDPAANMGLIAYFIRISELRKKVLRFVKSVDLSQSSQLPDHEFATHYAALIEWFESLPSTLHLNSRTIYIRKESNQLAALLLLHCAYHVTICDLYRVGNPQLLPSLMRHRFPKESSTEHQQFLSRCRKTCFDHAKEVARILEVAVQHGPKMLSDTWLPTVAYESIRIMLCQITDETDKGIDKYQCLVQEVLPLIKANMRALELMLPLFSTAGICYQAANKILRGAGLGPRIIEGTDFSDDKSRGINIEGPSIRDAHSHITPESVLNPLAIYSLARKNLDEKHTPEAVPVITSKASKFDSRSTILPAPQNQDYHLQNQTFPLLSSAMPRQYNEQFLPAPTESTSTCDMFIGLPPSDSWTASSIELDLGNHALDFMHPFNALSQQVESLQEGMGGRGLHSWSDSGINQGWDEDCNFIPFLPASGSM